MDLSKDSNNDDNKESTTRCVGRPKKSLDSESRFRRDVANTHERKRMQSINDGILALRRILRHKDIDKLSKATVLLRSAEYLIHLETELNIITEQNIRLKSLAKNLLTNKVVHETMAWQQLFCEKLDINNNCNNSNDNNNDINIKIDSNVDECETKSDTDSDGGDDEAMDLSSSGNVELK